MQLHRQALYGPPSHCSYRNLMSRAIRPIDLGDLSVGATTKRLSRDNLGSGT
jgi:hypothetical protein